MGFDGGECVAAGWAGCLENLGSVNLAVMHMGKQWPSQTMAGLLAFRNR